MKIAADYYRYGATRYGENVFEALYYVISTGGFAYGAFKKGSNKLVSWVCSEIEQTGVAGTTLPEYEGLGLHVWIMLFLQSEIKTLGRPKELPGWGYIPVTNERSLSASRFLGGVDSNEVVTHFTIHAKNASKL